MMTLRHYAIDADAAYAAASRCRFRAATPLLPCFSPRYEMRYAAMLSLDAAAM